MIRRRLLVATASAALAAAFFATARPASADAPARYGWWSTANVGLGFSAAPPQVPSDGMYVANGFSGPVDIAAATFSVPAGAAVGQITLHVAGNPVITSPPVACPITAAGLDYKAAEGGPWSDAPKYDCTKAKITATVASNHSTVSFDARPLLRDGVVAVVFLAGGPADQIAFDKPGSDALAVSSGGTGSGAGPPVTATPAGGYPGSSVAAGGAPVGAGGAPVGAVPAAGSGLAPPVQSSGGAAVAPSLAPSTGPSAGSAAPAPAVGPGSSTRASTPSSSTRGPVPTAGNLAAARGSGSGGVWKILALIGLIGVLVAYTEGYGLLGGRFGRPSARRALQPAGTRRKAEA